MNVLSEPPTVTSARLLLESWDTAESAAAWAMREAARLGEPVPERALEATGRVVAALVDNALRHGMAPVTVEVDATSAITILVKDHGPGLPIARTDGSGSLAMVVNTETALWDVTIGDGSKTVTAMVPLGEMIAPRRRRRAAR